MKVSLFFNGIIASFGFAWILILAYPFYTLKDKRAFPYEDKDGNAKLYSPTAANYFAGELVYRAENCQACHTQVIRNSSAGSEVFRKDWAGREVFDADGDLVVDTRRESDHRDYTDRFASIGESRLGPDLMNLGVRVDAQVENANAANADLIKAGQLKPFTGFELLALHLYDPRNDTAKVVGLNKWSVCPSNKHLFKKVSSAGQGSYDGLPVKTEEGYQLVPTDKGRQLINYLLGKRHDQLLPEGLNKGPAREAK
jgi:hypothetical protein